MFEIPPETPKLSYIIILYIHWSKFYGKPIPNIPLADHNKQIINLVGAENAHANWTL